MITIVTVLHSSKKPSKLLAHKVFLTSTVWQAIRYIYWKLWVERGNPSLVAMKKISSEKYLLSWVEKCALGLTKQTPKTLQEEERKAAKHRGIQKTKGRLLWLDSACCRLSWGCWHRQGTNHLVDKDAVFFSRKVTR